MGTTTPESSTFPTTTRPHGIEEKTGRKDEEGTTWGKKERERKTERTKTTQGSATTAATTRPHGIEEKTGRKDEKEKHNRSSNTTTTTTEDSERKEGKEK